MTQGERREGQDSRTEKGGKQKTRKEMEESRLEGNEETRERRTGDFRSDFRGL